MIVDKKSLIPNSMSLESRALFLINLIHREEIFKAISISKDYKIPFVAIGSGTNVLLNNYLEAVVVVCKSKGIKKISENIFNAQAGEIWDDLVRFAVENGYSGTEALSGIPGTVGAAPVQNIGAYGKEISENIYSIEVYDRKDSQFKTLTKKECNFGYRNSIFKQNLNRFIIVSVNIQLSREKPEIPQYKDVKEYFYHKENCSPSPREIREAILEIRKNKLPNYLEIPNVGSYFVNPIIDNKKIYAGELIEKSGFEKGCEIGKIKLWKNSALILTNPAKASLEEILFTEEKIKETVFQKYGVLLEREPVII